MEKAHLIQFFKKQKLELADTDSVTLASSSDGRKVATVTFQNKATFEKAMKLPKAKRVLTMTTALPDQSENNTPKKALVFNVDDKFLGFTALSEGTEVE